MEILNDVGIWASCVWANQVRFADPIEWIGPKV
jgi:hypothetical protein